MPDMRLAERHARIRAHEDDEAAVAVHQMVLEYFGGDIDRAIWFMQERSVITGGRSSTFFSVRSNTQAPFYSTKDN